MNVLHILLRRVARLFMRRKIEDELDEEMRFHLEQSVERNIERGMTPDEARREAMIVFGGVEQSKEVCRDAWGVRFAQDVIRDLKYSARSLWKNKAFSVAVIGTLALCIGANTTVLSAFYSLILKPLPVENPDNLVQLFNSTDHRHPDNRSSCSGWNQYVDLKARDDLFAGVAYRTPTTRLLTRNGASQRMIGQAVSVDFFDLMGAQPIVGRFFRPEEADARSNQVMVLSQTTWETEYDGDPNVLGQQVTVDNGLVYTIIGVAPRSMEAFDRQARYTIPYHANARARNRAQSRYNAFSSDLWLRLKPGVSHEAALEQIRGIERRWYEQDANQDARESYKDYQFWSFDLPHPLQGSLYLLQGGALLILLVGCFNVMALALNRMNYRRHELSVRTALGAGKTSLQRLMMAEGFWLIGAAVMIGLALSLAGTHVINEYLGALSPRTPPIVLDGTILITTLLVVIGVLTFVSLLPLEVLWRTGLLQRLDQNQRSTSAGKFSRRLSNGMVVAQVAFAFILLVGSGLLLRSFYKVMTVDPGIAASQVVQGRIDFDTTKRFYPRRADAAGLKQRIHSAMQEIPGVESVSLCMFNLFSADLRRGKSVGHIVSPEFFTTMGMKILEGRDFRAGDNHKMVIVDELYARRFHPEGNAVGSEVVGRHALPPGENWPVIVGVVTRANFQGLEERDGVPFLYSSTPLSNGWWEYSILLRTSRPVADVIREMRAKLQEIDPRIPLSYARPLNEALDEMLIGRKGVMLLLLSFAGLAVFLSALGVYSLLAYDVQQRRQEIGIRSAIGASRNSILNLILRQGVGRAVLGLGIGLACAFYLTRFLETQLFDIAALDFPTYLTAMAALILVALLASLLPALRAVNINPVETLKID